MSRKRRRAATEERRALLKGLATGLAGAVATPSLSAAAETRETASRPPAQASAPSAGLLDPQEHATLVSLSELLVPGSVAAGAPELVDRVGSVESPREQQALRDALRAFEGQARLQHGAPWVALDDDARVAMLQEAASGSGPRLSAPFVYLRDRIAEAYFATEPGMRKLGWTPRSAWRELPACNHPGDDHR